MNTAPIPDPETIIANPALFDQLNSTEQLAVLLTAKSKEDTLIASMEAELKIREISIDQVRQNMIAPKKLNSKNLRLRAEQLVNEHRKAIMDKDKTLELCGHSISFRFANSIAFDATEEEAVAALEVMAHDDAAPDADRMSAEACLKRGKTTVNKSFCQNAAKKSAAWLRAFGIRLVRSEKLTIKSMDAAEEEE